MSLIIEKTYQLIDTLDNSELVKNLKIQKNKLIKNNKVLKLISAYHQTTNHKDKVSIKKKLYQIPEYQQYINLYSELSLIIFRINKQYLSYTNTKTCQAVNHQSISNN